MQGWPNPTMRIKMMPRIWHEAVTLLGSHWGLAQNGTVTCWVKKLRPRYCACPFCLAGVC
ncbi:hypothetical protein LY56_02995 [Roseinatronobacter thiooxidans]|uniref:Uncharacterized protein n=1 Tax=Roseinatronobacter thiooxidans TaxID=121821 RepID=A0A2W7RK71_9RHOB|nr:hypothetical protein LY56_02995 [Roseinatronobacter thiooxidans]